MAGNIERRTPTLWRVEVYSKTVIGQRERYRRSVKFPADLPEREKQHRAELALAQLLLDVEAGNARDALPNPPPPPEPEPEPEPERGITLAEFYAGEWLPLYAEPSLSAQTVGTYKSLYLNHIGPYFGDTPLVDIDRAAVMRFTAHLRAAKSKRGKSTDQPLSPRTVLHHYNLLSSILDGAVTFGHLDVNPMRGMKKPTARSKPSKPYSTQQMAMLFDRLQKAPRKYRAAIYLAASNGMRSGELAGLRYEDIDTRTHTITINRARGYAYQHGVVESNTKSENSDRINKIPDVAWLELMMYIQDTKLCALTRYRDHKPYTDSGYVFQGETGEPIHPDTIGKWFAQFLVDEGLPRISIHKLRTSHASILINAGTDILTVAQRLGDDPRTILKYYARAFRDADDAAAEAFAVAIGRPNFIETEIPPDVPSMDLTLPYSTASIDEDDTDGDY